MADVKSIAAAAAPDRVRPPTVGDMVWFFDDTRAQTYTKIGAGPYPAVVLFRDVGGLNLHVIAGRFDVERVQHKSLLGDQPGKKRWWEWPTR